MLEKYIRMFKSLRRAPGSMWSTATNKQAPHKPLLLMSVMDLVAQGAVTSSFIDISVDLKDLNDLFAGYWRKVVPLAQSSSIAFPFSRLHNEPFWELVPKPGIQVERRLINSISTVSQLREVALGARMDDELFQLFVQPAARNQLRQALIESCFSTEAGQALCEQSLINAEAFSYSTELFERAHLPLFAESVEDYTYERASRDQGFRKAVVTAYDHRCALCGVRIVTPEGHTVVDAAHIVPWRDTQNDDIRNGMALCKLCHWAFDEGMMGVSEQYTVVASRQIGMEKNVPGLLLTLSGRGIIPPQDRDLWPAQEYLAMHRRANRF